MSKCVSTYPSPLKTAWHCCNTLTFYVQPKLSANTELHEKNIMHVMAFAAISIKLIDTMNRNKI